MTAGRQQARRGSAAPTAVMRLGTIAAVVLSGVATAQTHNSQNPLSGMQIQQLYTTPAGEVFTVIKRVEDGRDVVEYRRGDVVLTAAQMRAYEAANPPPIVEPALQRKAAALPDDAKLRLTVWLRNRPGARIAREVRAQWWPVLESLAEQVRQIHRSVRPADSLSPQQERAFLDSIQNVRALLSDEQKQQLALLDQAIEEQEQAMRAEIRARIRVAEQADQDAITRVVERLGGRIVGRIWSQNAVTIELPAGQLAALASEPLVAHVIEVPPATLELDNQAVSLGLTTGFWANGIDGGIWDAGVLDTGVQQDHPALSHLTFLSQIGTTDSDGHGTGVAGIIASDDATYRGMAFGIQTMLVGSLNTPMTHADWMVSAASDDPENINLSAGYGRADDTDYSQFDQFWDGLIDDNSVMVSKSAGNGGDGTTTITHPAPAYNLIAVANIYDQNNTSRSDDVIWGSSSRGPTLNGRKKPDIAAPGQSTMTTNNGWNGGPDFVNLGGTSAAAPHVGGAVLLLTELRGTDSAPYAAKAVLINTADAWTDNGTSGDTSDDGPVSGSEWNKTYGWGYLDLWEAWFNGLDVFVDQVDDGINPPGPDFKLYRGTMFAGEKATLVWNRHVGYNGSNYPTAVEDLSDLDLLVYDEATGQLLDSSLSARDNVEQVAVSSTVTAVVKVDVFGSLDPDVGIETFALATEENFEAVNPPAFTIAGGASASPGRRFTLTLTVTNTGDVRAFDVEVDLGLPAGFSIVSGDDPQLLGDIDAGGSAQASWVIEAPCTTGNYFFTATASSVSYGESFSDATTPLVTVVSPDTLVHDTPVDDSQIEKTWAFPVQSFDWSAVGLVPQTEDHDIWADDDLCITSPYQLSIFIGTTRDFVVTNGHSYGSTTHYALVTYGSSSPYTIELDQAFDLLVGSPHSDSISAFEAIETYEVNLTAGVDYRFTATVDAGAIDFALFAYRPDRSDGDRGNADFSANASGPGGDEVLEFTAPVDGYYYFVLTNENHNAANYTVLIEEITCGPGCEADLNDDCVVDLSDLATLLADFGQPGPADYDNDGTVDLDDLALLLSQFGNDCN